MYGYESGSDELAPWWVALGAGGPARLVLAIRAVLTFLLGRRAVAAGRPVA